MRLGRTSFLGAFLLTFTLSRGDDKVFTNEDLARARGNMTYGGSAPPETGPMPEAAPAPDLRKLKVRYRRLRRKAAQIEERDLPAAHVALRDETLWARPKRSRRAQTPKAASRVQRLVQELEALREELSDIEREAHRAGLSTVGLLRD